MRRTCLAAAIAATTTMALPAAAGAAPFTQSTTFVPGQAPFALAAGDLNRDGKADLVVANFGSSRLFVMLGDGAGHLTKAAGSPITVDPPRAVAIGDVNSDGMADLVTSSTSNGKIDVLLGNGGG